MQIKIILICLIFFISSTAYSRDLDTDYLRTLKYKIMGFNLKLPTKIDEITTIEEIRLLQLKNGDYYVTTMSKINTDIRSFGDNRNLVWNRTIDTGCKDPAVVDYMKHGLKIGVIYKNSKNETIDIITYSIEDCN